MTAVNFCYWLQGFYELLGPDTQNLSQEKTIEIMDKVKAHLNMVFVHDIDPQMGGPAHQAKLNALHQGGAKINVGNLDPVLIPSKTSPLHGQAFGPELDHSKFIARC